MRFLLLAVIATFLSCNKQDLSNCKITKITFGLAGPSIDYSVVYSGKTIVGLNNANGDDEKYTFTYDGLNNLIRKDRFFTDKLVNRELLTYNSSGQILSYKFYSYLDSANGELLGTRDYAYTNSKLAEIRVFVKGSSQAYNWVVKINWDGQNPATYAYYNTNGTPTGCLNPIKYTVEKKENQFNKLFPQFRYLDMTVGEEISFIYLTKGILTRIQYPCERAPNDKVDLRYTFNDKGLISEIYKGNFLLRRFEYDCN
jgi:hypothetical protein